MAIDDLLDEHEQGERVRTWLRDNGAGLIGGVALGLALIGGWQWWQKQQAARHMQAGAQFQSTVDAIQARNLKQALPQVAALDGTYAVLGALELAKAQLQAGQRDAALSTLRKVNASDPALASIVRQRKARLLIDAGKAKEAAALIPDDADASSLEVRGDAQVALGNDAKARADYQRALTQVEVGSPQRRLLELKLSEVGGTPNGPEAQS